MLLSHRLCDTTLARHEELAATLPAGLTLVLALTEPLGRAAAMLRLPEVELLSPRDVYYPAYEAKAGSGKPPSHNTDLALLAVWRRRPGHGFYWLVEYDVWMPKAGATLAALDAATEADYLVPFGQTERRPGSTWHHWSWFRHPPDAAAWLAGNPPSHALQCLERLSAPLLAALDAAYRAGWSGHPEALLPTIARLNGLSIEAMRPLGRRLFGRDIVTKRSFRVRGAEPEPGAEIYHPVKTEAVRAALAAGT
ncbi:MAG: hypothetical protein ACK4PG_05305 [Acetobacteraceae bacterium]